MRGRGKGWEKIVRFKSLIPKLNYHNVRVKPLKLITHGKIKNIVGTSGRIMAEEGRVVINNIMHRQGRRRYRGLLVGKVR
jgi:hypothetical protein